MLGIQRHIGQKIKYHESVKKWIYVEEVYVVNVVENVSLEYVKTVGHQYLKSAQVFEYLGTDVHVVRVNYCAHE